MNVTFCRCVCETYWKSYEKNGSNALQLIVAEDNQEEGVVAGDPMATASVCFDYLVAEDELLVKDWDTNEGMVEALIAAGVIAVPHLEVQSAYAIAKLCKLTPAALAEVQTAFAEA